MNLSREWLSEFTDTSDIDTKAYCDRMTDTGSKVEGYKPLAGNISGIVAGKIVKMEKHPDADRLNICQIDIGGGTPVQIITSAQNVYEGAVVPACLDGAVLPDGTKIKKTKFRGIDSYGMMCSFAELGLTEHEMPGADPEGILLFNEVLDCDIPLGRDVCDFLGMRTDVVEFEITPNRPDCLSVIGLARETGASFGRKVNYHTPAVKGAGDDVKNYLDVSIESPLCSRYTARVVKNVKIAPSPLWMRMRLFASGVRPINNIVDITNYVMLEYGQPMHAFDYSCLDGSKIVVKEAQDGQVFRSLDDIDHVLKKGMLTIQDSIKPVALAGVMGGANSEIKDTTGTVVFESACFDGASVRVTSRALGMRTESSGRFEKGLDCENTKGALERACELVEMLGAGEVIDGVIDITAEPYVPKTVKLEPDKINALLGTDVSEAEMRRILTELGFTLDGDTIIVPSWRGDIEHYSDIAEEVARFYGYNNIPVTLMRGDTTLGGYTEVQKVERELGALCRSAGYNEIITYSFISPSCYDKICLPQDSPLRDSMKILNPLGEDTSIMRTTVLPSMLEILARNYNYRNRSAKLYEIGRAYFKREDGLADEPKMLSLGAYGDGMDFFKLKGAVETALRGVRVSGTKYVAEKNDPSYHPGRCAKIYAGDIYLGTIGQIHPKVAANYSVDGELYAAVLSLDAIMSARAPEPRFVPLPKFPTVIRDIAVVCDDGITVGQLEACIKQAGGAILKDVRLFDIYKGSHIEAGKKSCAFSLTLRSDEKTLTDSECDAEVAAVLTALENELGAVIR